MDTEFELKCQKVKTKNVLSFFEINSTFRTSVHGFFYPTCHALTTWFELSKVKLQQMKSRRNRLWFELARGWSYRGFELSGVNCMFKK